MTGLSCNSCNKEFVDEAEQKLHYKSEWHRYNLKRKSRENMVRMKVLKAMNRSGVEAMRTKIGMKSNVIRNLPNNVTY